MHIVQPGLVSDASLSSLAQAFPPTVAWQMLSKLSRPYNADEFPQAKSLRANLVDLFASNVVSGHRAQELFADAHAAGAANIGALSRRSHKKHACRDLSRKLLKLSAWPDLYMAKIRVWNTKVAKEEESCMAFLLPHELLARIAKFSTRQVLMSTSSLDPKSLTHLQNCQARSGQALLACGLWGDGVPCNWDRTDSLELFTLNLPGLPAPWSNIRIPLCALSKKHISSKNTYDDLLGVLAWSFKHLAIGKAPSARHDGSPFGALDGTRRKTIAGKSLDIAGTLVEVRGDWKFMKECFAFPAWNENAGCCWMCTCTPNGVRQVGADAPWRQRQNRLSHFQVLQRIQNRGVILSPLFQVPWLKSECFRVDWLHSADQGVTGDFLGNLFYYLVTAKLPGPNEKARCAELWQEIQNLYVHLGIADRLQNLTIGMLIKKAGGYPKLRASAAQTRALVKVAKQLVHKYLSTDVLAEQAMTVACDALHECYDSLSSSSIFWQDILPQQSRRFAAQLVALETYTGGQRWRVKPKLHLFLEMCSEGSQPSKVWTYRDEDFGGSCAQQARRRGGLHKPAATSKTLLTKFRIKNPVPRIP